MPNFEVYQRKSSRWSPVAAVTISRHGKVFLFTQAACEMMGNPEAIKFLYDKDESLAGFRPATAVEDGALRMSGRRGSTCSVSGSAFCNFLRHAVGLDMPAARRWPLKRDKDGTCYIDLKQPGEEVTSNRKSR